jgi:hypothetical protein
VHVKGAQVAAALYQSWRDPPPPLEAGDYRDVCALALESGAAALLSRRLPDNPELKDAHRLQRLYARVAVRQLAELLDQLAAVGVEPLLAKGLAVARHYPEPGLRAVGDLDLYVRARDYQSASRVVRQFAAPVDLHRGLSVLDDRSEEELWSRSTIVDLGDCRVRVPSDEDHARLIALHLLAHGAWRPLWLCDLAVLVDRRELDWSYLFSGDPRRTRWVECALGLASLLLGAELPRALDPPSLPSWLAPALLAEWGRRPYYRVGLVTLLGRPWSLPGALWRRYPNLIEASFILQGAPKPTASPRLQLEAALVRVRDRLFSQL